MEKSLSFTCKKDHPKSNNSQKWRRELIVHSAPECAIVHKSETVVIDKTHNLLDKNFVANGGKNLNNLDPRWKFRLRAFVGLCILVVPGNLATLAIYLSMQDKISNNETLTETFETASEETTLDDQEDDNSSSLITTSGFFCHEKHDFILPLLDSAQFWIEGISLTLIATIGLLGNLLTIVVLLWIERGPDLITPNARNQSSFNAILICLVTFDTFFLIFSLMDSGFVLFNQETEPDW